MRHFHDVLKEFVIDVLKELVIVNFELKHIKKGSQTSRPDVDPKIAQVCMPL